MKKNIDLVSRIHQKCFDSSFSPVNKTNISLRKRLRHPDKGI